MDGKGPIHSRRVGGKKRCFEQARTNNSANTDRRTKSMGRWTYAERWGQEETDIMYDDGGQLSCLYIYHLFFPFYFIRRFGIQGGRGSIIIISSIPMYEIYRRAFVFLFSHSLLGIEPPCGKFNYHARADAGILRCVFITARRPCNQKQSTHKNHSAAALSL